MENQSIGQLLKWGKSELRETNLRSPDLDAEVLLMEVLDVERLVLHVYPERVVEPTQLNAYQDWIRRRKAEEPLHYITGKKEFMGLNFHVEKGVLIPRGDTEVVVEAAIKNLKEIGKKRGFKAMDKTPGTEAAEENASQREELRALDIGVGSGAIAVSLLYYVKNLYMVGTDISTIPLKVTEINAKNHGVAHRLELLQGSLFEPLNRVGAADKNFKASDKNFEDSGRVFETPDSAFDLIISNPPYISFDVKEDLDREVKDYEPEEALFAREQGLYYYREIAGQAPFYLKKNGVLIFEIGYDQGDGVRRIVQQAGFKGVQILKDLENRDRVVIGKR